MIATDFVRHALTREGTGAYLRIAQGRMVADNGIVALSSPTTLTLNARPLGAPFLAAIKAAGKQAPAFSLTDTGRVSIRAGKLRAYVECAQDLPEVLPQGKNVVLPENFMDALRKLLPLVGADPNRPWAQGVLLRGQSAYATNNIILAEHWLDQPLPELLLPKNAVQELLRIDEVPHKALVNDAHATFFFSGDRWLLTRLYTATWPDVAQMLASVPTWNTHPVAEDFYASITTLSTLATDRSFVRFTADAMVVDDEERVVCEMAHSGADVEYIYPLTYLKMLEGIADAFDFGPTPALWTGHQMRGVLLGRHA